MTQRDIAKDKASLSWLREGVENNILKWPLNFEHEIAEYWIAQYEELKSSHDIVQQFYDNLCIRSNEVAERLSARISELEARLHPNNRPDVVTRPEHDRALEKIFETNGCIQCAGKGYFEYKTGVVSPHMPYEEEVAKDPCDCVLDKLEGMA